MVLSREVEQRHEGTGIAMEPRCHDLSQAGASLPGVEWWDAVRRLDRTLGPRAIDRQHHTRILPP
jgi:hypothetical protein